MIFTQTIPNTIKITGVESEKVLGLTPGKESSDLVNELWTHMEAEMIDLIEKGSKIQILNQDVEIKYKIHPSQFDNSTLKKIHG